MDPKTLIIGASGFIGANLLKEFESCHVPVKAMSRNPERIQTGERITAIKGDLEDPGSLENALEGIETIYYLAHSLDSPESEFMEREKEQANNLARFLNEKHRLIYLGGIAPDTKLSPHLESRKGVGEIFQKSKAKTIEFRASIVIGRGSASFEMMRALVNRLPFVVTASWSDSLCQPIAIKDVVSYLFQAKDVAIGEKHSVLEIGGADKLKYGELLTIYAKEEGLLRPSIHLKEFPRPIAKEIMKIVVPEYYEVGSKLLDSIETHTTADNDEALRLFDFIPMGYKEAVDLARDPNLKESNFTQVLQQLKAHPMIPSYLAGQTLQKTFELPDRINLQELGSALSSSLPFKLKGLDKGEYFVKVPFVGELKIVANTESNSILIAYKPKYFFQAGGWAFINKVLEEAAKRLK